MKEVYPKNDSVYKTQKEVEEAAKKYGFDFVTYPADFDFNDNKQRFITAEEHREMYLKQNRLLVGNPKANPCVKSDFDRFYERLLIDENIKKYLYDMVYFYNDIGQLCYRPFYSLVLQSGADIDINLLEVFLNRNSDNLNNVKFIVNQFFGQMIYGALKGAVRRYYTELICTYDGYTSKASKAFMTYYFNLIGTVTYCIDASIGEFPPIIKKILNAYKTLSQNRTMENANKITEDLIGPF